MLVLSGTRTHLQGYPLLGVRLVAIITVATASAYLVELPIRRGGLPRWWAPAVMPVAASLAVLTTFLSTVGVGDVAAASVRLDRGALGAPAGAGAVAGRSATTTTFPAPVKVLIVGDSMAGTLGVGLGRVMAQYGVLAVNEGSPGCSVSMDQLVKVLWFTDPPGTPCQNGNPNALLAQWRAWVDQFNPDVVIYLARSEVLDQEVDSTWTNIGVPSFDAYLTTRFHQAISVLGSRGAHVVLLTSPFYDTGVQPSGLPWPEDDPNRVTIDNQIIESMADPPPGPGRQVRVPLRTAQERTLLGHHRERQRHRDRRRRMVVAGRPLQRGRRRRPGSLRRRCASDRGRGGVAGQADPARRDVAGPGPPGVVAHGLVVR